MFWADRIAEEITKRFGGDIKAGTPIAIRDEKTLSGRVHVGSMRGVAIHGLVHEILNEQKVAKRFSL
jgi:lysyl-tRNA synthetase class I